MTNLRFAYPGTPQTEVLRNINLQIDAGTCTAIVGASGCGKSTIASLLLRLYDPLAPRPPRSTATGPRTSKFEIPISPIPETPLTTTPYTQTQTHHLSPLHPPLTYAYHPSPTLHTPSLRNHTAYVPQTPFLFPTTVYANLAYGLHDASPLRSAANLTRAAQQAGIHDFIISLPQGWDTLLGDGGLSVSGGQAQRLCIARALARRPRLLVLDEPTSALDGEAAGEVRRVVRKLVEDGKEEEGGEGMAVVVVTHSKEMMRVVDRVVMVEGGVVVEEGGYEELVARGGRFKALVGGGVWTGNGGERGAERGRERERRRAAAMAGSGEVDAEKMRADTLRRLEGNV